MIRRVRCSTYLRLHKINVNLCSESLMSKLCFTLLGYALPKYVSCIASPIQIQLTKLELDPAFKQI